MPSPHRPTSEPQEQPSENGHVGLEKAASIWGSFIFWLLVAITGSVILHGLEKLAVPLVLTIQIALVILVFVGTYFRIMRALAHAMMDILIWLVDLLRALISLVKIWS